MRKNMSMGDRLVRTALAAAIIILLLAGQISGIAAVILGIIALIFLVTSGAGFCPLYALLGISTLKREGHEEEHHGGEAHGGAH